MIQRGDDRAVWRLNESPSEKEGKSKYRRCLSHNHISLNESPSEKEGKLISAMILGAGTTRPQ